MGKTRVPRLSGVSDAALAEQFAVAVAADVPPTPPAPLVEDLSLPQAVWPPQDDAPKARIFAEWADGVMDLFRACAEDVQKAIVRNLAAAAQAGKIATTGTSDGKAITPVSATLFAEMKAKAEVFLASLPIVDRGLAAERVKTAGAFVALMATKNPNLDLTAETTAAELAEKRVRVNFLTKGVDFRPAIEQADAAAAASGRLVEEHLVGQFRDKANEAGQSDDVIATILADIAKLESPADRRYKLVGQIVGLTKLLEPMSFIRPANSRPAGHDPKRARFTRRG